MMTFSIVDRDKRYDESNLIDASVKHSNIKNEKIYLKRTNIQEFIRDIRKKK